MYKEEALRKLEALRSVIERMPDYADIATHHFDDLLLFNDRAEFESVAESFGQTIQDEVPKQSGLESWDSPLHQRCTFCVDGIMMNGYMYGGEIHPVGVTNG